MPKKKRPRVESGFILRNTVIKEVDNKPHLDLKHRTITKETKYKKVGKKKVPVSFVTTYNEGDVIRRTEVHYLKNLNEVERKVTQGANAFKKTKKTNFTSVVQYFEGQKPRTKSTKFSGKVPYGTYITKSKRLQAILRKDSKVTVRNKLNTFLDQTLDLESEETSLLLIHKSSRKYHTTRGRKRK